MCFIACSATKFGRLETLNVIHRVNASAYGGQQFGGKKPNAFNPQHDTKK